MGIPKKNKKNNLKNFTMEFGCLILGVKKMEKEKTPKTKKAEFDIKNLSSYKSCQLDVKNLQNSTEEF